MIKQLRPFYSDDEEAKLYAAPYDHTAWPDHRERINYTASILEGLAADTRGRSVADLSCGDGGVLAAAKAVRWSSTFLGDRAARPGLDVVGPIEETISQCPEVDLFVCTETLEHVRDPLAVLKAIRARTKKALLLSTPAGEEGTGNPQHCWGWDPAGIFGLLRDARWHGRADIELWTPTTDQYYTFQIWQVRTE
jgi:hypothetical protein